MKEWTFLSHAHRTSQHQGLHSNWVGVIDAILLNLPLAVQAGPSDGMTL
jgi:hypothetical protein